MKAGKTHQRSLARKLQMNNPEEIFIPYFCKTLKTTTKYDMYSKARLFTLGAVIGLSISALAQRPQVTSAAIAIDRGDVMEAKGHIDDAKVIVDDKGVNAVSESTLQKYYYRRGQIYTTLANNEPTEEYINEAIENLTALIAYEKAIDDDDYTERSERFLQSMLVALNDVGFDYYESQDYQGAYNTFSRLYNLRKELTEPVVDTASLYTMMSMAQQFDKSAAVTHIRELLDLGYTGVHWQAEWKANEEADWALIDMPDERTMNRLIEAGQARNPRRSENIRPQLYVTLVLLLQELEREEEMQAVMAEAAEIYPDNSDIKLIGLQSMLNNEDYAGALTVIEELLANSPNDPVYLYNAGFINQEYMDNYEAAAEYYDRTIAADSTYFDAMYMAGVLRVDLGNQKGEEYNAKPMSTPQRELDALLEAKKDYFRQSLEYFLMAEELKPNDAGLARTLFEVYYQIGDSATALEYKRKAERLEAAE